MSHVPKQNDTAKVEEKQTGIYYIDPLPKLTSNKEELQAYRYCVIDGNCYATQLEPAVLPDGRPGYLFKNVCAGPVEKVKQKIQDRENGVVTPSANSGETQRPSVTKPVKKVNVGENTMGRPVTLIPEDFLNKLFEEDLTTRQISERLLKEKKIKVSHVTIAKIKKGQGVLV